MRILKFFKVGGWGWKILKEKCLLIHISTGVHIKTRQTCNSFSLLPFHEDCLLFFAFFYYSLLLLKFKRRGCNPRSPPLDPPMFYIILQNFCFNLEIFLVLEWMNDNAGVIFFCVMSYMCETNWTELLQSIFAKRKSSEYLVVVSTYPFAILCNYKCILADFF